MNEPEAIRLLTEGAEAPGWMGLGPGDDTALLHPPAGRLLWTTDLQAEGVHFRREWLPLRLAARRALAVNLSDLASMGGSPLAYLLTAGTPGGSPRRS